MKTRIIFLYGIIAGLINCLGWVVFGTILGGQENAFESQEIFGYVTMMISLLLIYLAVKKIREKIHSGILSFKKSFSIGVSIALIASLVYVAGWEIYYPYVKDDLNQQYIEKISSREIETNAEEIEEQKKQYTNWVEYYENPFIRTGITFMEIFPLGVIMSLLTGLALKTTKRTS